MKPFLVNIGSLRLIITLIGYPEMGESQIIIIKDINTNYIYFSAVIDCYVHGSINKTIECLNNLGVKELNLFCWTHPDDDHSIGLSDIVDKFCTKKTRFVLPEGIYGQANDFVKYSVETQNFIDKINSLNTAHNYNVGSATVFDGLSQSVERMEFADLHTTVRFEIQALAPISSLIRRRIDKGLNKKNDISIALLLHFGQFKFFLSGDIEDQSIRLMNPIYFENLNYLKTPHHTSNSSAELLTLFDEVFGGHLIGKTCTTVYQKHNLPSNSLINEYKKYTKSFYSTGIKDNNESYGIIEFQYELQKNDPTEYLYGNAHKVF